LGEVGERERRDARDGALARLHRGPFALQVEQQLSLVVPGTERRQAQLADQFVHAGVAFAEPLPAELERRAVIQYQALGTPAAPPSPGGVPPAGPRPPLRPPTRSRASTTVTSCPCAASRRAAASPASPAPITTTSLIRSPRSLFDLCGAIPFAPYGPAGADT